MHPILERPHRLGLYLLIALQAGLLLSELLVRTADVPRTAAILTAVPLLLVHSFSCLASWYLCRVLPLGSTRPERLLVSLLVAGVLASALVVGLGEIWSQVVLSSPMTTEPSGLDRARTLFFVYALLVFSLAVALHYLFLAVEARRAAEGRAFEMRLLAREAELQALKAQVDPHFLFNSLNSISSLVAADPQRARAMCLKLAEVLRQSLRLGERPSIYLKEELAVARSYLEVEEFRFGDRMSVQFQVEDGCENCEVPPLLLQPLVENSVRHGIAHLLEGGTVQVRARRHEGRLILEVVNPCDPERPASRGEGIGLANVQRRLAAAFGDEAKLVADEQPGDAPGEGLYRVRLQLPCSRASKEEVAPS